MKRVLLIVIPLLLLSSCIRPSKAKLYKPSQVAFQAEYNPVFDGQLYPSLVLGLANYVGGAFGDSNSMFSISVTAPENNSVLRVVVDSSVLNYVTIFQEVLPKRGERYTFYPTLKWKYESLYRIRQQGAADLTFTCYINDEEVDVKNIRLNYRSVNECLLSIRDLKGVPHDFRWMFSAYVNEEHPYIDSILAEILDQGIVTRFSGYQSGSDYVHKQVLAIWYYALNRGLNYSSITCTANPSKRSNVQHIRFFDEVYHGRQANCVDACVFFASIMRKIGLKPVIFVEPCHAYLGYYTDRQKKKLSLLETTITGWVDLPALERSYKKDGRISDAQYQKVSKYLSESERQRYQSGRMTFAQLKHCVAVNLFDRARVYDQENYTANKAHFSDSDNLQFQQLDIETLRKQVQPIN